MQTHMYMHVQTHTHSGIKRQYRWCVTSVSKWFFLAWGNRVEILRKRTKYEKHRTPTFLRNKLIFPYICQSWLNFHLSNIICDTTKPLSCILKIVQWLSDGLHKIWTVKLKVENIWLCHWRYSQLWEKKHYCVSIGNSLFQVLKLWQRNQLLHLWQPRAYDHR